MPNSSVKSNIGHLDAAAGVAGLLKTVLALQHKYIPPSINFNKPNPSIDFDNSRFSVASKGQEWSSDYSPRRAGVSSFGIGGSNVHVILQEAPAVECIDREPTNSVVPSILRLSAMTPGALDTAASQLASHIETHDELHLEDIAFTLQHGRKTFSHRMAISCHSREDAIISLNEQKRVSTVRGVASTQARKIAFMFPGQGTQYAGMASGLRKSNDVFRENFNYCSEQLFKTLGVHLAEEICASSQNLDYFRESRLSETWLTQPALFSIEYSLARMWQSPCIEASAMIGHSVGEYVAACLAGVFSLDDGLKLVAARGKLLHDLPKGSMLAISKTEDEILTLIGNDLSIAAVNSPSLCVVSGNKESIAELKATLEDDDSTICKVIPTSHAFHSAMVEPCMEDFSEIISNTRLHKPRCQFISNVSGDWISEKQAQNPDYWVQHMRGTVRFAQGIKTLCSEGQWALIECGPGQSLSSSANRIVKDNSRVVTIASLPKEEDEKNDSNEASDQEFFDLAVEKMWCAGVDVQSVNSSDRGSRVALPTYAFERKRFWIDAPSKRNSVGDRQDSALQDKHPQESSDLGDEQFDSSMKNQLARLWSELLGVSTVSDTDDFFDLGGDSMLSVQFAHKLRQLGVQLRPNQVLEQRSFGDLSEFIENTLEEESENSETSAKLKSMMSELDNALIAAPEQEFESFDLTDIQYAYWIGRSDLIDFGQVAAHAYEEYSCPNLDIKRLEQCLREVINRHSMLRAIIDSNGQQRVLAEVPPYNIDVQDFSNLTAENAKNSFERIRAQKSHQILSCDTWPLFDLSVSIMPDTPVVLHISFDLLIADAWTISVFFSELEQRYRDASYKPEPPAISYRDYVVTEQRLQSSEYYKTAEAYWMERLEHLPAGPVLPMCSDDRLSSKPKFVRRTTSLSASDWSTLKSHCNDQGITPSALLCTAYVEILALWSETDHFCINMPAFNRLPIHPDVDSVLGDFTSVLLLEANTKELINIRERAKQVQAQLWESLEHVHYNGVKVIRKIASKTQSTAVMPIVFTSLIFSKLDDGPLIGSLGERQYGISQTPQVWLDCQVFEESGELHVNWDALENIFEASMLDSMFEVFSGLLNALVTVEADSPWQNANWQGSMLEFQNNRHQSPEQTSASKTPKNVYTYLCMSRRCAPLMQLHWFAQSLR